MYKSIKIYSRTRCQVSVYRTTGPLVKVITHSDIIIIIIIKSLFSEDYILSTGTYLTYGPLNIKNHLNIYTNYVHLYKETIGIDV